MEDTKPPVWFWVVAVALLVWNLLGVGSFIQYLMISEEDLMALSEAEREIYYAYPAWALIAFAVATWVSTFGVIGLLLRKTWSRIVLIAGFAGIVVQMFYNVFISKNMEVYGPGAVAMPVMIIIIAVFLIWLAGYGTRKGWLSK